MNSFKSMSPKEKIIYLLTLVYLLPFFILVAANMDDAIDAVNDIASEHMEIVTKDPFHIMTTLKDDIKDVNEVLDEEDEEEIDDGKLKLKSESDTFSTHLQFLEQFFKVILNGIDSDSFEALNSLVVEMYNEKGISSKSDFEKLKPEDYPIFDDLYAIINDRIEKETDAYHKRNLLTI